MAEDSNSEMLGALPIQLLNVSTPKEIAYTQFTCAEIVVRKLCQLMGVKPIMVSLYALNIINTNIWLNNSLIIASKIESLKKSQLILRIRWKINNVIKIKNLDLVSYNYFFHQIRYDMLHGNIEYNKTVENYNDKVLGLVVTDMYRAILEENKEFTDVIKNYKMYTPKKCMDIFNCVFVKNLLNKNLKLLKMRSEKESHLKGKLNSLYVKQCYLEEFEKLCPTYLSEDFKIIIEDVSGKMRHQAVLCVNAYCSLYPGMSVKYDPSSKERLHLCSIEDLCFISISQDGQYGNIEISRKNGVPVYMRTYSVWDMISLVSLLDGYYRLQVKWTFNLCKDLPSPSLQMLMNIKCHGPISGEFSYTKLEEKRNCDKGCYILRESDTVYGEYYLDVCCKQGCKPDTFKIIHDSDGHYVLLNLTGQPIATGLEPATSLLELLQLLRRPGENGDILLPVMECIPPSEYDESNLLICRVENSSSVRKSRTPVVISLKDLQKFTGERKVSKSGKTEVYPAIWRTEKIKIDVYMKQLIQQPFGQEKDKDDWQALIYSWCFLDCSSIVKLFGMTLWNPVSMISEALPKGALDVYLLNNSKKVQEVDLVQAATGLSSALWYLTEAGIVHGNIRCHSSASHSLQVSSTQPEVPVSSV